MDSPERKFVYKRDGRRYHAFSKAECPYPLACDRAAIDLFVLSSTVQGIRPAHVERRDIVDQNHLALFKGSNTCVLMEFIVDLRAEFMSCSLLDWDEQGRPRDVLDLGWCVRSLGRRAFADIGLQW